MTVKDYLVLFTGGVSFPVTHRYGSHISSFDRKTDRFFLLENGNFITEIEFT